MPDSAMPDWRKLVRNHVSKLRLSALEEATLVAELSQHLDDAYRDQRTQGLSEDEAYRATVAELETISPQHARVLRSRGSETISLPPGDRGTGSFWDDLTRDARYAVRNISRNRLFVVFVVLTLGLGIGANTTMFTLINTVLLNPLPVSEASKLFSVCVPKGQGGAKTGVPLPLAYADLQDYQANNGVFQSIAGYSSPRVITWQSASGAQRMFAEMVTGNYFSTLGLHPALGRYFRSDEDKTSGMAPVAVLNYGTWKARFGSDPHILGKTLTLDHVDFTIIGVAPPNFIGVNGIFGPDLWVPATMAERLLPNELQNIFSNRAKSLLFGIGRLKPGVTPAQAQSDVRTIAARLAREYPDTNEGRTAAVWPTLDVLFASASTGSSPVFFASVGLLVVVGIVLLIACSNVANLMLAKSSVRQQEMAIRLALGASRPRLIRQLLTESVLLGLFSGAFGFFLGFAGLRLVFGGWATSSNFITPKFDSRVFLFALCISLATGLLFGILPALRSSRTPVVESLKEEARTAGRSRRKVSLAGALLVGQVAFSFLLLILAALFLKSMGRAYELDPGFQTAHLAVFMTSPGQAGLSRSRAEAFYKNMRERVTRLPEVESVSWSSNIPLWTRAVDGLQIEGRPKRSQADSISTIVNTIDSGFFATAGIPIERGRLFTDADRENALPVAIVNAKVAQEFFPKGDALGKRIRLPGDETYREIVGIVRNATYTSWGEPPQLCAYVPLKQKYSDSMVLYVRTRSDPRHVVAPVQNELRAETSEVITANVLTGPELISDGLFQTKMGVGLLSAFGMLALVLASIGLYGIMAYTVMQRKREIGVRLALGAPRLNVLQVIIREGMTLVITGALFGLVGALISGRLLNRFLFGVSGGDPLSIAAAFGVLVSVALIACYLPARSASRLDPLVALREN